MERTGIEPVHPPPDTGRHRPTLTAENPRHAGVFTLKGPSPADTDRHRPTAESGPELSQSCPAGSPRSRTPASVGDRAVTSTARPSRDLVRSPAQTDDDDRDAYDAFGGYVEAAYAFLDEAPT